MTYRMPWRVRYWHAPLAWLTSQRHKLTVFAHARDTRPYTPGPAKSGSLPADGRAGIPAGHGREAGPGGFTGWPPKPIDYIVSGPREVPHSIHHLAIITGRRLALEIAA